MAPERKYTECPDWRSEQTSVYKLTPSITNSRTQTVIHQVALRPLPT